MYGWMMNVVVEWMDAGLQEQVSEQMIGWMDGEMVELVKEG